MHAHTHARTHAHTHTYIHTYIHTYTYTYSHLNSYRGRSVHYISTHIEDISENGGDMLHLTCVHGANVATGASRGYDEGWFSRLLVHNWKGNWEPKTDSQR